VLVRRSTDNGTGFELNESLQGVLADGAQDVDVGTGQVVEGASAVRLRWATAGLLGVVRGFQENLTVAFFVYPLAAPGRPSIYTTLRTPLARGD